LADTVHWPTRSELNVSRNRSTDHRNSPEAAALVNATFTARDGPPDWHELAFLCGVGTVQILGVERERFMELLPLYLAEIDGVQARAGERALVRLSWERWNVTSQMLEREMKTPLEFSRAVYEPAAVTA